MKRTNSFVLFGRAFKNAKNDFWVSIQVLLVATFVLALLFYFVEHTAQPEEYKNPWDAFVWAITRYIGDPGKFAGKGPITLTGRYIDTFIGILKILIFAVPAGLVANGFRQAMADEKKLARLNDASAVLHKRFRRSGQSNSWYRNEEGLKRFYKCVDRFRSLVNLQIKTGMSVDEILATVKYCPDMRLQNLASTIRKAEKPQDRIVVEHFPLNREYGCFIDRGSNVTIVSPASTSDMGAGNSSFSLAAMGGFNYVSKEIEPCIDEPFGFLSMSKSDLDKIGDYDIKEDVESQALHFMDDLSQLKKRSEERHQRHWFIFIVGSLKTTECQLHFWRLATDKKKKMSHRITRMLPPTANGPAVEREYGSTVLKEDEETLNSIFTDVSNKLSERKIIINENEQSIVSELDNTDRWGSFSDNNINVRMGGGVDCNAFLLRIADEILVYCNFHLAVMKDIADCIKKHIEPEHEISESAKRCFLKEGDGFADDFGKEEVFMKSPEDLKAMIKKWKKYSRDKFEHLDINGNEQADYAEHHQKKRFWQK